MQKSTPASLICSFVLAAVGTGTAAFAQNADTNATSTAVQSPYLSQPLIQTNEPPPAQAWYSTETAQAPGLSGTSQISRRSNVPLSPVPPLLHWGPLTMQTRLTYDVSYGNGLQPEPGHQSNTVINRVAPGIAFQWGNHWNLDYTPSLTFYSSHAIRDSVDHSVTLSGGTTYGDWSFGLFQNYATISDPIIETSSQVDEETFSTGLNATRQLGSRSSLQLGASQNIRTVANAAPGQSLSDTRSWATMDWFDYRLWRNLSAGVGAGFGYDDVSGSVDMASEQLQGRVSWVVVKKLSFYASGGAEDRQFLHSGIPDLISPIFTVSGQYSLFEATSFSITASRSVSPSFFQNQVAESTSLTAGVHQRLLGKISLDLTGGYGSTVYHGSTPTPVSNVTSYDSTSFSARLGTAFLKRGTAAVYYTVTYNSSSAATYDYTTTQVGLQLSYRY